MTQPPAPARTSRLGGRRLPRRLVQLYAGLVLYGVSMALLIRSELGNMPWDVLHQGLADRTGVPFGLVTLAMGFVVLLLWIPLRERPGFGTVSNALVVGPAAGVALTLLPSVGATWLRVLLAVAGLVLNAVATAAYIGARLGPGPRDGLMTGLVRRTGGSVRAIRTGIEVSVVGSGWLLGGTVGAATAIYALGIGPLTQVFLPLLTVPEGAPRRSRQSLVTLENGDAMRA